jgi:hypothetical protein
MIEMPINSRNWIQAERHPTSKQRDPIQGEFFNTDSIVTLAAKLTREGIGQNPMDAYVTSPVVVRVYVSGEDGAVAAQDATKYFGALRRHVAACDAQAAAQFDGSCRFLVIEDFNTTGLLGDESSTEEPPQGVLNHFFYFFRAEGKSGKSGAERGRWGVGKYVFPMASHINTFFGLTIRSEGQNAGPLLMGQTVLKNHYVAGKSYEPDGWWAEINSAGVPVPIAAQEDISEFRHTWRVARVDEPGLSIVIPYVREDLTANDLKRAIILDYYLAILSGKFIARIGSASWESDVIISPQSLQEHVQALANEKEREEITRQIEVSTWRLALPNSEVVVAGQCAGTPKWTTELLTDAQSAKIRTSIDGGGRVVVRVPVNVQRKDEATTTTSAYFDVLLVSETGHGGKPQFVREGLFVPEVSSPRLPGIRSMVVIDDPVLARMVGDAEGPAHANWSAQTEKFSGKYRYGQQWLTFVKRAPAEILRIVRGDDLQADRTLMTKFFPLPTSTTQTLPGPGTGGTPGPGPTPPPPPPPPPPKPRKVRVSKIEGGFSLHLTEHGRGKVNSIRVLTAYDRRSGNAFANWSASDFDLASGFTVECAGGVIQSQAGNEIRVIVRDEESFSLRVRGFDVNRDVRVDADPETAQ